MGLTTSPSVMKQVNPGPPRLGRVVPPRLQEPGADDAGPVVGAKVPDEEYDVAAVVATHPRRVGL